MCTYSSFHCCLNIYRIYLSNCLLVKCFQGSPVLSDAAVDILIHAFLSKQQVPLGCPELELLDQQMHVSSTQVVWKLYTPIYTSITSVERDSSAPPTCQHWISSFIFTYLLGMKLYPIAEVGRWGSLTDFHLLLPASLFISCIN